MKGSVMMESRETMMESREATAMSPDASPAPTKRAIITVGLPACGKSTYARGLAATHAELNLDDLRAEISGDATNQDVTSRAIGRRRHRLAELAKAGRDVILSDTHAKRRDRRRAIRDLRALGYEVEVVFFDVGEATCHRRNAARARQVPASVIAEMAERLRHTAPTPHEADRFTVIQEPGDPLLG
jgi:predicted kinase